MANFELKGVMTPLTELRLLHFQISEIFLELQAKINESPVFFQNSPLVLDLTELQISQEFDLACFVSRLRELGLCPVGLRGGDEKQRRIAASLQLGIFSDTRSVKSSVSKQVAKNVQSVQSASAMFIDQKIRSGQRIHAKGQDLVVFSSVSNGAEIVADGNIHVYGTLSGRAMAGGATNTEARIFCLSLDAELVAVAGQYFLCENISQDLRDCPVQIFLQDKKQLVIKKLV